MHTDYHKGGTQFRRGRLDEENKNQKEEPIEFASVTLSVPQVAANTVAHDDLSCLRRLPRGDLKTLPTEQEPNWSVTARRGCADSNSRGDPRARGQAAASACIGIERL